MQATETQDPVTAAVLALDGWIDYLRTHNPSAADLLRPEDTSALYCKVLDAAEESGPRREGGV